MIEVEQIDKVIETRLESIPVCYQCGKCSGVCPLSFTSDFRPRLISFESLIRMNEVYKKEFIWQCTTCNACVDICPQEVNPPDIAVSLRSHLVEEGHLPQEVNQTLENIYKRNNPWGNPKSERVEWTNQVNFEIKHISQGAELLYFVGCGPSYDPRCQEVAKSLVTIFDQMTIDFGILGNDEKCCGDPARRLGEEGLFQMLAEDNINLLNEHKWKKMVVTSPHCYQVMKNEYPDFREEIIHYTQFLAEGLETDQLKLSDKRKEHLTVTYQDPCYLGRYNNIYDPPRAVLSDLPNVELIEMSKSREESYCCGGGGGRMWMETDLESERPAEIRIRQAMETGADVLVTACPFCLMNFDEAIKTLDVESEIEVKDLAELVSLYVL